MSKLLLITILVLVISCQKKGEIILSKHQNGQMREIILLDKPGVKDSTGVKKTFFENGKLKCFGPVLNNLRNGSWTCYYDDGTIEWKATYEMDVEQGEVFCRSKNGSWSKFTVVNGIKEGKVIEYGFDANNNQYGFIYGQYENGLEQGLWTKTDTNGVVLIEMTYVKGERIGYFTNRYKNGKIRLKGELNKDGSMKNFTFFDELGMQKTSDSYIIERI